LLRVKLRVPSAPNDRVKSLVTELGSLLQVPDDAEADGWFERLKKFLAS
jgi:hypothetical protein